MPAAVECVEAIEEVRPAAGARVAAPLGAERVAFGEQGGELRSSFFDAQSFPFEYQPRQPRGQRQGGHPPSQWGHAVVVESAQVAKRAPGTREPRRIRGLVPVEGVRVGLAPDRQFEHRAGEVDALDLGRFERPPRQVVAGVPEAQAEPGRLASGAAGPLVGGGPRDLDRRQAVESGGRIESLLSRQAAVDHRPHALDRHRGFRQVGGQDDTPPRAPAQGGVLLGAGQVAVQRIEVEVGPRSGLDEERLGAGDLGAAGQKRKQVAVGLSRGATHRIGHLLLERTVIGAFEQANLDRVDPAGAANHRCVIEPGCQRLDVEGGRHDEQMQIRPGLAAHPPGEGQCEVRGQGAFVELVEDQRGDAIEERVALQPAQQHALGREHHPAVGAESPLEPDPPADFAPERPAALVGNPARRRARRDPPRLDDDDLTGAGQCVGERWRHAGGLAGSRGRVQHRHAARADRCEQRRQDGVDWQRRPRCRPPRRCQRGVQSR